MIPSPPRPFETTKTIPTSFLGRFFPGEEVGEAHTTSVTLKGSYFVITKVRLKRAVRITVASNHPFDFDTVVMVFGDQR